MKLCVEWDLRKSLPILCVFVVDLAIDLELNYRGLVRGCGTSDLRFGEINAGNFHNASYVYVYVYQEYTLSRAS